jgi:hypothetical protein
MSELKFSYENLTDGKKRLVKTKYLQMWDACTKTFYNKINGVVRLRKSEQLFFEQEQLLNKTI